MLKINMSQLRLLKQKLLKESLCKRYKLPFKISKRNNKNQNIIHKNDRRSYLITQ